MVLCVAHPHYAATRAGQTPQQEREATPEVRARKRGERGSGRSFNRGNVCMPRSDGRSPKGWWQHGVCMGVRKPGQRVRGASVLVGPPDAEKRHSTRKGCPAYVAGLMEHIESGEPRAALFPWSKNGE